MRKGFGDERVEGHYIESLKMVMQFLPNQTSLFIIKIVELEKNPGGFRYYGLHCRISLQLHAMLRRWGDRMSNASFLIMKSASSHLYHPTVLYVQLHRNTPI